MQQRYKRINELLRSTGAPLLAVTDRSAGIFNDDDANVYSTSRLLLSRSASRNEVLISASPRRPPRASANVVFQLTRCNIAAAGHPRSGAHVINLDTTYETA